MNSALTRGLIKTGLGEGSKMDKRRLIIAILMMVLAAALFFQIRKMGQPAPQPVVPVAAEPVVEAVQYADVLVAAGDISFGSRLSEANLAWKKWPADVLSSDYITQDTRASAIQDLNGGVVRAEIYAGEPITERKVVMPGEKSVMSALLQPGMRAVTTRISVDTAAGGFIQPGDNVDIILTSSITAAATGTGNAKRYVSQTIFENVRVLAIDQTFSTNTESGASVIGSTATFEMTQGDSELLQQSVAQGDLSLTLRPIGRGKASGQSTASVKRQTNEVSSLTIIRNGQPTQVAIKGQ